VTPSSQASSKAPPLAVLILVTLSLSGCSAPSAIRSDSSPSYAAVEAALAPTGVEFCNVTLSPGGTYCDSHYVPGHPSVAMVFTGFPASFFSYEVGMADIPHNSVWVNGRTIVGVPRPGQAVVTALDQNGFKRYRST